jgi:hypothetical protein
MSFTKYWIVQHNLEKKDKYYIKKVFETEEGAQNYIDERIDNSDNLEELFCIRQTNPSQKYLRVVYNKHLKFECNELLTEHEIFSKGWKNGDVKVTRSSLQDSVNCFNKKNKEYGILLDLQISKDIESDTESKEASVDVDTDKYWVYVIYSTTCADNSSPEIIELYTSVIGRKTVERYIRIESKKIQKILDNEDYNLCSVHYCEQDGTNDDSVVFTFNYDAVMDDFFTCNKADKFKNDWIEINSKILNDNNINNTILGQVTHINLNKKLVAICLNMSKVKINKMWYDLTTGRC